MSSALQVIELYAGQDPQGQPVVERLRVTVDDDNNCRLVHSPAFIKGLASGDKIKLDQKEGQFTLLERSGNLSVRVFCREGSDEASEDITPKLEKLGGELDIETPHLLVYTIHVSCGFKQIESILESVVSDDVRWMYGNVYDPEDGVTPLNWWQEVLKPE